MQGVGPWFASAGVVVSVSTADDAPRHPPPPAGECLRARRDRWSLLRVRRSARWSRRRRLRLAARGRAARARAVHEPALREQPLVDPGPGRRLARRANRQKPSAKIAAAICQPSVSRNGSSAGFQVTSPSLITYAPTGRARKPKPPPPLCSLSPPPPPPPPTAAAGMTTTPSCSIGSPKTRRTEIASRAPLRSSWTFMFPPSFAPGILAHLRRLPRSASRARASRARGRSSRATRGRARSRAAASRTA